MPTGNYLVKYEESVFDVAIKLYGSVDSAVKLFLENTDVIDTIHEDIEGATIVYDTGYKEVKTAVLVTEIPAERNLAQIYNPTDFQTIFDVALMLDGGLESIVTLVNSSTLNNINTEVKSSDRFTYIKKSSAVLDWIEKTGQIFQTKTPLEGNTGREFDRSYDGLSFR